MPDTLDLTYLVAGVVLLLAAALPRLAEGRAFSAPMVFLAGGILLGVLPIGIPDFTLVARSEAVLPVVEHVTELVVIIALFGVGLAIDRPFGLRRWASTWRLLGLAMPLCIASVALLGWSLVGLAPAAALLLGAALAPTDPVLASEVQVGKPSGEASDEDEVRFALTSEAGLNDGLAFPFVYAAIFLAAAPFAEWGWGWLGWEVVGKVVLGVALGAAAGFLIARLAFARAAKVLRFAETAEALVALAAVFLAYGFAEVLGGYGFIAVFVAALVLRGYERDHEYHEVLHEFIEQVERILTLMVLLVLGWAVADGLLAALSWQAALVAVGLVVLVRPVLAWLCLAGLPMLSSERVAIAFFGVRGIGSFYYLAYAMGQETFEGSDVVWATAAFAVLFSVVLHGASAGPIMDRVDARRAEVGSG